MIFAATLVCVALFILNVTNQSYYTGSLFGILFHLVLPVVCAAAVFACLWLSSDGRLVVTLCLFAVIPALYGVELYLGFQSRTVAAGVDGDFDRRSKLEVIQDFRRQGIDAYPLMRAKSMLVEAPDKTLVPAMGDGDNSLLPLASLPGKRIVACNETGRWMIYESDQYGFHNPSGVWEARRLEAALVGDSFAHGSCQTSDKNIAAQLRKHLSSVLNLGIAGFGPLSELATIKEYLTHLKPRHVFWFYFEGNDLFEDMLQERRSKLLMSYLEDGFSQRLMFRRDEVSSRFKTHLDAKLTEAMSRVDHPFEGIRDFLELYHLRENLGLDPIGLGVIEPITEKEYGLFQSIIGEARRTVESWGGRFVFVYLPDSARYWSAERNSSIRDHLRRRVLDIIIELDIPVIDIHTAVKAEFDPKKLFVFAGSHFNQNGYRLVAQMLMDWLDGQLFSNLSSSSVVFPPTVNEPR